ncbi:MAG: glutamine--tRNA ligase/YqeY domain fusion protein [Phycisphaerales bacterium]|nr:glutamine--tRNA ligase/YqeY domain fusion protein [Phycisphaerales bacterium]
MWSRADAGPLDDPGAKGDAARARLGRPRVHTRFPPEPNGYLHIGHAKSICLNFGLARENGGKFNLRFDDTNPAKEEQEFVDSITRDVRWLGADFEGPYGGGLHFASNYFGTMYGYAVELIKKGRAYVCELSAEEVSKRRGTPTVPGTSPFRDRPAPDSLRLIDEMRRGLHADGSMTVRARIDLASPNFNLRDPVLYRILHEHHHNTGGEWCIYPMYDWAHGLEDSIEGITHSNCTLEFENHRPLYDWFIDAINEGRTEDGSGPWGPRIHHPRQIEFAKLQLSSILLSKRNLRRMVEEGFVAGWDDPRMPTLSAFRRRGFTPESIRALCDDVGCTKFESLIDLARLENACRDHLNKVAPRAMAVLNPLRVTIENWPEGRVEHLNFVVNPEDPGAGTRTVPFSRTIYIERDDFMEHPEKGFFRLAPGAEVRLRWAYFLTCTGVEKDASGAITGLRATIDPATRGGDAPVGPDGKPTRKVKGTIHWVSCDHALPAEVRLYDRLFTTEEPGKATGKWEDDINPLALQVVRAFVDPALAGARYRPASENGADVGDRYQFERLGYFCVDPDSGAGFGGRGTAGLVLNRTVTLKDSRPKAQRP